MRGYVVIYYALQGDIKFRSSFVLVMEASKSVSKYQTQNQHVIILFIGHYNNIPKQLLLI